MPPSPPPTAPDDIGALVSAGHTVAELESSLGLSPGYLSKVRHGVVRPSAQLVALLHVLRSHPETLVTIRRAVGAPERRERRPARRRMRAGSALHLLVGLVPAFDAARVRWALAGAVALGVAPEEAARTGIDLVVHDGDRHVLALLREAGLTVALHPPSLAVVRVDGRGPNEGLRMHFPTMPPLSTAFDRTVRKEVLGASLPAVDLESLTLANLLSQRTGAEDAAAQGLAAGVSIADLDRRLAELEALPPTNSPYVLRLFDRALARQRLSRLTSP